MKHGADQPAEISEAPPTDEPPLRPPGEPPTRRNGRPAWLVPVGIALGTSAVVTGLSYGMPDKYAATAVGLGFLAATYWVALRRDHPRPPTTTGSRSAACSTPSRSLREWSRVTPLALWRGPLASRWPSFPFWFAYRWWWKPRHAFESGSLPSLGDDVLGQLLVIALPEEAFYRGYLQTALDDALKPRIKILGATIGWGLDLERAVCVGDFATEAHPNRLAVFFPALVFGWLRARTGGIGAGIVFHALCNLFAAYLARSYGDGDARAISPLDSTSHAITRSGLLSVVGRSIRDRFCT